MKKLLLSFLPLLLVVLGGFSASAQDFSTTVTWATPGSIEVIKGGNPTLSTAEKMTLGPDQMNQHTGSRLPKVILLKEQRLL